jgi:hypothetical protein
LPDPELRHHKRQKCDHLLPACCPCLPGSFWLSSQRAIDTGTSGHDSHPVADFDLGAQSLGELKKMQKAVAKAISTVKDWQMVEACTEVEAFAGI